MKYLEEYLQRASEIAKQNDYPVVTTLEQCIAAIALVKELQDIDETLIFQGGTATQFYLDKLQRLSQDADIITNKSPTEVKKTISSLEGDSGFTFKELNNGGFPVLRYGVMHNSLENPTEKIKLKLEITHSVKPDLPTNEIKKAKVFSCNIENLITLEPTLLLPRKMLTFNIGGSNCGLREQKIGNIAKHTYDAHSLIDSFSKSDLIKASKQFDLACNIETDFHRECKYNDALSCLENISNSVFEISNCDFPPNKYRLPKEVLNSFDATANFLKTKYRKNRAEWVDVLVELGIYSLLVFKAKKTNNFDFIDELFSIKDKSQKLTEGADMLTETKQKLIDFKVPKAVQKREPRVRFLTSQLLRIRDELKLPINWKTPSLSSDSGNKPSASLKTNNN